MTKATSDNRKVSDMFASSTRLADLRDAVTRAEGLHENFTAQHNLSFFSSYHMTKLYKKMFPDTRMTKYFAYSRMNTACILNDAMMPSLRLT